MERRRDAVAMLRASSRASNGVTQLPEWATAALASTEGRTPAVDAASMEAVLSTLGDPASSLVKRRVKSELLTLLAAGVSAATDAVVWTHFGGGDGGLLMTYYPCGMGPAAAGAAGDSECAEPEQLRFWVGELHTYPYVTCSVVHLSEPHRGFASLPGNDCDSSSMLMSARVLQTAALLPDMFCPVSARGDGGAPTTTLRPPPPDVSGAPDDASATVVSDDEASETSA